jgi:YidC/Oxa1 family membrane protein insertase
MDFQRVFLFLILSFSIYTLWDGWEKQQHPVSEVTAMSVTSTPVANSAQIKAVENPVAIDMSVSKSTLTGQTIDVTTDFLHVKINTLGGDITRIEFMKHFDTDDKAKHFVLLENDATHKYLAQTGLLGTDMPTHNTLFAAQDNHYELLEGKDSIVVNLSVKTAAGIEINKVFTFHKSSYLIDIKYVIDNAGKTPINTSAYFQLVRDDNKPAGGTMFVPTYTGAALYTEKDKFKKIDFPSIEKHKADIPATTDNGWVGMLQHYFVSAWLPTGNVQREFYAKQLDSHLFSIGLILPIPVIEPGKTVELTVPLYAGPAHSRLDSIAEGLGLSVDYGFLTIIAKPIFWLLSFIHGWVQNWGLAIIILTILIKLAFFPLSAASYRSMAKMRMVAPKLAKIKEQYGDDRERLNKSMMELYKTEKINPLGGCLPVIIQIPVFISLYWSILSSVEMRYAPFIGWITDLSKPDPFYVLPVIMGVSMLLQTRLNPTPPDPMQAKLMQIMPIAFSVVFFFFPAGLVLYSVVNNVLSILQQWYITRSTEAEAKGVAKV